MDRIKVTGLLLLFSICAVCESSAEDPPKQKAQSRKDSYDDILRPPPPPPNLANMRLPFMNSNQRFQRTNQFRQPHFMRQLAYPQQERYPLSTWNEPQTEQSILQKISSWFFPGDSSSAPATYGPPSQEPPPSFAPPIRIQSGHVIQHNQNSHNQNGNYQNQNQHNHNQQNQNQQKKKECNLCNQFPWVPVIRYPNAAIGVLNHDKQPSKQLSAPQNSYLPPNDIVTGPSGSGKPLGYDLKPPITNSYGAPIPPNSYDSPLPITNDGGESPILTSGKKPYNPNLDVEEFGNHGGRHTGKDTIENLESNNVPLVSKPNQENPKFNRSVNRFNSRPPGIHVLQPIPFPNLSPVQIPPIFNARPFKTAKKYNQDYFVSSTQRPLHLNHNNYNPSNSQSTTSYQLLPSVSLAEFTSSIDYPISIIQSPLVEIDATKSDNGRKKENALKDNIVDSNNVNLNKNPIVVHNNSQVIDSYSAASGGNDLNTNQESVNFVTRDTNKNEQPFLPTPIPHESNSNRNIVNSLTPISYSFIDQTFSSGDRPDVHPTSTPSNFYNEHNTNYIDHSSAPNNLGSYSTETLQSLDSPLLYLRPSVPHKESKLFRHVDEKITIRPLTESNAYEYSTPVPVQATSASTNTGFRYLEHNSVEGKWPPPLEPFTEKSTIKPKRIQIIIPYTTKNQPSPFKFSGNDIASPSGWVPVIADIDRNYGRKVPSTAEGNTYDDLHTANSLSDYHESSESKIITASAQNDISTPIFESSSVKPKKPKPTDLIEPIRNNKISFDVKKLQQNIDEWTSLEYSKIFKRQQKASTTSHLKRSKKIPDEYLTTTPAIQENEVFLTKINDLNRSLLDSESAGSIQYTYETNLYNETSIPSINNSVYPKITIKQPGRIYYTSNEQYRTTGKIETTTIIPKTTTKPAWEKIQTSISPLTKEKVYVVTPQPWHIVNSSFSFDNNFNKNESNSDGNIVNQKKILSFKSPRFLVRPTPGPTGSQKEFNSNDDKFSTNNNWKTSFNWLQSINNLEETTTETRTNKGILSLSTVTAYTPPDGSSIHTYSGHSRVITSVTPSSVRNSQ